MVASLVHGKCQNEASHYWFDNAKNKVISMEFVWLPKKNYLTLE
jgi:hypothetical protein